MILSDKYFASLQKKFRLTGIDEDGEEVEPFQKCRCTSGTCLLHDAKLAEGHVHDLITTTTPLRWQDGPDHLKGQTISQDHYREVANWIVKEDGGEDAVGIG